MDNKKIILITNEYLPKRGGAGVYCEELIYASKELGISIEGWVPTYAKFEKKCKKISNYAHNFFKKSHFLSFLYAQNFTFYMSHFSLRNYINVLMGTLTWKSTLWAIVRVGWTRIKSCSNLNRRKMPKGQSRWAAIKVIWSKKWVVKPWTGRREIKYKIFVQLKYS